jgi:hypothetical protein
LKVIEALCSLYDILERLEIRIITPRRFGFFREDFPQERLFLVPQRLALFP